MYIYVYIYIYIYTHTHIYVHMCFSAIHLFLQMNLFCFMFMSVCLHVYIHTAQMPGVHRSQKRCIRSLGTRVPDNVSNYVGYGHWTQILSKSSQCSQSLSHVYSLTLYIKQNWSATTWSFSHDVLECESHLNYFTIHTRSLHLTCLCCLPPSAVSGTAHGLWKHWDSYRFFIV